MVGANGNGDANGFQLLGKFQAVRVAVEALVEELSEFLHRLLHIFHCGKEASITL